jgi:hypothetical protein
MPATTLARHTTRDRVLRVIREAKVRDLLANQVPGVQRFEASGVVAADGALWVVFDNTPMIARLSPDLRRPGIDVRYPPGRTDYEDIAHDPVDGTYYVLVESVRVHRDLYMAQVNEFTNDFSPLRARWLDHPVAAPNKGMEGLTCVRRDGRVHLLGICEGNRCRAGRPGRRPGGGRVHVFAEGGADWRLTETIELPADLRFIDYSGLSVRGERIAVVSQESSAMWVGRLSPTTWDVSGAGTTYFFPRTRRGRIRYGTVEGVCWLDERMLAVASDRTKADQPRRMRATDQSVHIVALP